MAKTSPAFPEKIKLNHYARAVLLDRLILYYQEHLEEISRIKSVQVLKDIFHQKP
jgi:hypothetical protein